MAGKRAEPAGQTQRQTVLVVADERDLTAVVRARLEHELPVRVLEADSGDAALAHLRAKRVELIITDQSMPGMTGTEFLAQTECLAPDVPRALLTARQEAGLAISALNDLHIVASFPTPLEMPAFISSVSDILARRRVDALREGAFDQAARVLARGAGQSIREPTEPFSGPLGIDDEER